MTASEQIIKNLESGLSGITQKLKQDFVQVRGNRPSVEMIENIRLNLYD